MRRSVSPFLLVLVLSLPLAACGDGKEATPATDDSSATTDTGGSEPGTAAGREGVEQRPRIEAPALPDAPALTDDSAESVLQTGTVEPDYDSRDTLLYLAQLGDKDAIAKARETLLAQSEGSYDDPHSAAVAFEALLASGDQSVAGDALDLTRLLMEDEDEMEGITLALARIEGTRQKEAEELLSRLVLSADDEVSMLAVEVLAKRRSPLAAEHLGDIAGNDENDAMLRATAVAGMLMTNDGRGSAAADALLGDDVTSWEIIDGFAIQGATEAVPYIQRIVDAALEEGNADFEFASACYSLVEIYGDGPGAEKGRAMIEAWIAADEDLDGDEATYALWAMGDIGRTEAAAALLTREVATAQQTDAEMAVTLLDVVAERGLARDPRFKKAVDAAAAMEDRQGLPGLDLTTQTLRAAAAHAYLRSR